MTTALVPISDMERMAVAFAKGGLFGTKTPEQCLSLLLLAQAEGQHPAIAMRDFDVIQGKPAKKAEAMLRSFIGAGGSVQWHQYDDNGSCATFSHPQGGTVKVDWDAARAKKAGLSGKDNYQKYGRAMYRSRVISEGVRTVYPAATSGMYVPEEVRAMVREEKNMGKAEVLPPDEIPAPDGSEAATPRQVPSPDPSRQGAGADDEPETREATIKRLCAATGSNRTNLLDNGDVKHEDELSQEDYDSLVRLLTKRLDKLADRTAP